VQFTPLHDHVLQSIQKRRNFNDFVNHDLVALYYPGPRPRNAGGGRQCVLPRLDAAGGLGDKRAHERQKRRIFTRHLHYRDYLQLADLLAGAVRSFPSK
jgi:hypothetical protein